mgnify:CR=1 FL=1
MSAQYVSVPAAASQLGIGVKAVRALIAEKQLDAWPQTTPGGRIHAWKVSQTSIDSYPRRARIAAAL